jgi:hypothetical protein
MPAMIRKDSPEKREVATRVPASGREIQVE